MCCADDIVRQLYDFNGGHKDINQTSADSLSMDIEGFQ